MPRPRNSPTNATVSAIQHQPSLTKTIFEKHHPRPVRLTIRSQMINFHRPHKMLMLPAHQESPEATPDLRTVLTIRIYPTPEPFPVKISNPTVYDFKIHEISHFLKKNNVKFCKDFTWDRIFFTPTLLAHWYVFYISAFDRTKLFLGGLFRAHCKNNFVTDMEQWNCKGFTYRGFF